MYDFDSYRNRSKRKDNTSPSFDFGSYRRGEKKEPVRSVVERPKPKLSLDEALAKEGYKLPERLNISPEVKLPVQATVKRLQEMPPPQPRQSTGRRILEAPANIAEGFGDSVGFGLPQEIMRRINNLLVSSGRMTPEEATQYEQNRKAREELPEYKAGQFAGYIPPGAAIERGVTAVSRPLIKNLPRAGQLATTGAAAGAIEGAAQEAADVAFREGQFNPENVAIGGAAGGAIGAITPMVGRIFQAFRRPTPTVEAAEEVLALPAPRARGNQNMVQTPEVINAVGRVEPLALPPSARYEEAQRIRQNQTLELPTPRYAEKIERSRGTRLPSDDSVIYASGDVRTFALPEPNISPPTTARRKFNPYRQRLEAFAKSMQGVPLPPGRERETFIEAWGRFARRDEPDLEAMIDLAYPSRTNRVTPDLVQRAREMQRAREVAGVGMPVRSISDRYQSFVGEAAPPRERLFVPNNQGTVPQPVRQQRSIPEETPEQIRQRQENTRRRLEEEERIRQLTRPIVGRASMPQTVVGRRGTPQPRRATETTAQPPQPARAPNPIQEAEEVVQAIQQPRVRDRVYQALDEAEKAARERMARRRNRLSANPVDEWADHAIIMAAKLGKGTIKAADFTEELVKEFGEQIRPHAERIFRQTREVLRRQERQASKEGQAARAFNESGVGDASTFDKKISRNAPKRNVPWAQRWERIRTQFADDLAPLERLEKRIRGMLSSAEDSLYKAARLFKGTPARAEQIVQTRLAPIVEAVEKSGFTADDLGRYALARHAKDVNEAGYKSGFTNAEIDDVLKKYGTPEMEAARQQLVQINRDMLQELVKSGVVSRELAEVLNERWKNYIPLFRAFDDDKVEFAGGLSQTLANVANPIKALQGSERSVIDPLENMVKNIFRSINAAERNKVAQQLAKLAREDKDQAFIRKLDPGEKVERKNVVNVKVNGENVKYEVEPEVYKALLNLDQESSNMLINVLSKPASLLRAGATLTPEFSLRNPMRDVLQAYVTSNSGFNPILDFGAGLIETIKKGPLYREWIDNLGAYGNIVSMDRDVQRQALEKVLKQSPSKRFVNIVTGRSLINILRAISDASESATKVGEYRAALRQGQTPQEAAYRSRDIMDFARSGSSIRQTNRIIAFLNANIQGKSKLIRAIKEDPMGTTTRMFVAVTMPTVGVYFNNHLFANETQKTTIKDAPDWLRDTFWLVAVPGTDVVARIPKPFDIAPIFANLPERALQFVQEKDPAAFDGFVQRTLKDSAIPFQISGLLPIVEGMANYSFFREGSIIPMGEENREFRDQYDPIRTTETAKLLARGAEFLTGGEGAFGNFASPRIMDNTIRGLTAGLGSYATSAIDTILTKTGAVQRPTAPEKRLEQRPLAKAFLVDPLGSTKSMDTFYTNREKLQRKKSSAEINEKPFTEAGKLKYLDDVAKQLSEINKTIRNIEQSDMTAKEKRERIDPLIERKNEMAREAVKRANLR